MTLDRVIAVRNRKTIFRDGDRCIKVFLHGYKKQDVFQEALNQSLMENLGISVPPVWEVTQVENHWAIVSPYVPGDTLDVLMEKSEDPICWLEKMAKVQVQLNRCSGEGFRSQKSVVHRNILKTRLENSVKSQLLHTLLSMPEEMQACHGHLGASNIIVHPCGKCCVVDFSHACEGSPAADAAASFLYFYLRQEEETGKKYLQCYCQLSGCDLKRIERYLPLMAACRMAHGNERERNALLPLVLQPIRL